MCTVSFIPISEHDFILTSNRDESPKRETHFPRIYEQGQVKLLYPKDKLAGGTWIGTSERQRLICLLNGGFKPHKRKKKYRMSRGRIVTDLLTAENIDMELNEYDLKDIEPFTLILVNWKQDLQLKELVWDGTDKYLSDKPIQPVIWSSSLLYSEKVKKKREQWFEDFLNSTEVFTEDAIINFHKNAGEGDIENNLIMNRKFVRTKSITKIKKNMDICTMRYEDLTEQKISVQSL
jgi:hypothetical protein